MQNRNLISITDLTKEEIIKLLRRAKEFEQNPNQRILEGKVVGSLFFEPSTRTRLSFETAVNRLGGRVIGFSDASTSSQSKGETLKDTIVMVSNYADLIVMRHPLEGAARYASEVSKVPIINDHHDGGRPEIRTHRALAARGHALLQATLQVRILQRVAHAGAV